MVELAPPLKLRLSTISAGKGQYERNTNVFERLTVECSLKEPLDLSGTFCVLRLLFNADSVSMP
jgi:hypothetical protein